MLDLRTMTPAMIAIIQTSTPTAANAIDATAEYLETLTDLATLKNDATPALRLSARRRFDEVRAYAVKSVRAAGMSELPMALAQLYMKERRARRVLIAKQRRERLEQRELLMGSATA